MKSGLIGVVAALGMVAGLVATADAGVKLKANEDVELDLGIRIQTYAITTQKDIDGDGGFEQYEDFAVRRARIKVGAKITDYIEARIQTESGGKSGGSGYDMRIIDAYLLAKYSPWVKVYLGEHMAAASRQNITSAGALLAIDRPGMAYKTLTWGTRALSRFSTTTIQDGDAGLRGDVGVRDSGVTLFGTGPILNDRAFLKYYLGIYDGIQASNSDSERVTARVQLNLFDAEPGYYNSATYLGKKKTLAVGASYDAQGSVAECEIKGPFDYSFYTVDGFVELPLAAGTLTLEAAYQMLDLDDAAAFDVDGTSTTPTMDPRQSQGEGFYVQGGFLLGEIQPWAEFEHWNSDHPDGKGSYELYRVGVTRYIHGHNASVKAGYERVEHDAPFQSSEEDKIDSFLVGLYLSY